MLKIHVIKSNICSLTIAYVNYKHPSLRIKTLGLDLSNSLNPAYARALAIRRATNTVCFNLVAISIQLEFKVC
jgi:hypothetical protein